MARELTPPIQGRRFEEFRRQAVLKTQPVQKDARSTWSDRFVASVKNVFGPRKQQFRKPGQPMEMFKARVLLQPEDDERWEEILEALEREWNEVFAEAPVELHTHAWFEGPRMLYEFVLLDEEHYLTGSITIDRFVEKEEDGDQAPRR